MGLLTGMRLITGLELLFWFLAMITRICFKFEGKEKKKNKIASTAKESAPVPSDAKQKRIDEMEDTIKEMNVTLDIIKKELSKLQ